MGHKTMNRDNVWEIVVVIMNGGIDVSTFIYEHESTAKKAFYRFIEGRHADHHYDARGHDILTYNNRSMAVTLSDELIG